MKIEATNSRLFITEFSLERVPGLYSSGGAALYQQEPARVLTNLFRSADALIEHASRLVGMAEQAYFFRKMDAVDRVADLLLKLPLPPNYLSAAVYFKAISVARLGTGDTAEAKSLFERVAEHGAGPHKARAFLALGTFPGLDGDTDSELRFYAEAARASLSSDCNDPFTVVHSRKMMAVLKGMDGDHRGSLNDLEGLLPLARAIGAAYPQSFCDVLNSYAVELAGAGRTQEAGNVSRIVVSSRFASAYPEWHETFQEVEEKRAATTIAVVQPPTPAITPSNVLHLPLGRTGAKSVKTKSRHQILSYSEWKQRADQTKMKQAWRDAVVTNEPDNVLRAEAFEVIGPDGEVRGSFRSAGGKTMLSMSGGKLSIGMVVTDDGTAEMGIIDRSEAAVASGREKRISLGIHPDPENGQCSTGLVVSAQRSDSRFEIALDGPEETPLITLYGPKGRKRMQLLALSNGKSVIRFYDRKERMKTELLVEDFNQIESLMSSTKLRLSRSRANS